MRKSIYTRVRYTIAPIHIFLWFGIDLRGNSNRSTSCNEPSCRIDIAEYSVLAGKILLANEQSNINRTSEYPEQWASRAEAVRFVGLRWRRSGI